jgi:hypothetical protein
LRDFLLSLKQKEFICQIGNFVKCRAKDEFETMRQIYEVEFQKVVEPNWRKLLNRTLAKAGLEYTEGGFAITEEGLVGMWCPCGKESTLGCQHHQHP